MMQSSRETIFQIPDEHLDLAHTLLTSCTVKSETADDLVSAERHTKSVKPNMSVSISTARMFVNSPTAALQFQADNED